MLPAFCLCLALTSGILVSAIPTAISPGYWFAFGDSYTQTGFNASGPLPSISNPIGNPPYPGNTNAGGSNYIGELTVHFNRSLIFTYNYAVGGATTDTDLVPSNSDMVDQANIYLNTTGKHPPETPWTSKNAIFSIWIGINDIGNSYDKDIDHAAFSDALLNRVFELINQFQYRRKKLLVHHGSTSQSVSIGTMLRRDAVHRAKEKTIIEAHNAKYKTKVRAYRASHTDVRTWIWDSYSFFTQVLDSPTEYGFNDATSYGHPADFWGNDYHPSSAAHVLFAKEIHDLLNVTVW